ncbi:quinone oxidoreductase-like [Paramacrobiotus metropolitanus]|uniref:quinone oxidoreductase-like n=1 Tax=Paramacrobiotus metropolitanus TaxID=2943436 RepID=UPI002445B380|nr:quinone oxidoreductase-like [Paramacrobiotus metropolitanus]XP_055353639.1 quinone oxidoreductase-like [Paramacrobiotus metropolitanus]
MASMRAIRIQGFGGPEVLKVSSVERPTPKPGQVLVQIKSAGVNPVDTYIRAGTFGPRPFPLGLGGDAAGIVAAVADGEKNIKVGDRVFTCEGPGPLTGTYAEYALVPTRAVFPLPDSLTFSQGAALGIPYLTALRSLIIKAKSKPHETLLVHGASGAVGLAACQVASSWGMKVFGTAGTDDGLQLIKANGAGAVFNHRDKNYVQKLREAVGEHGFDVILEMVANHNLGVDVELAAVDGRIVVIGSHGEAKFEPFHMMGKEVTVAGVMLPHSTDEEWRIIGAELVKGINSGHVRPVIDQEFPLEKAPEAHEAVIQHTGGSKGKIVLTL